MGTMASQQQREDVVVDEDGESSTGESSPLRVLPLDALKSLVPECKEDENHDIPACAWDTIDECITEATVRLAFESANAITQDKRKVITAEDVTRAIDGLNNKDAGPGMVILEMNAILAAERRAAAMRRRRQRRLRQELEAERKANEEEQKAKEEEEGEAAVAALEEEGATSAGLQN